MIPVIAVEKWRKSKGYTTLAEFNCAGREDFARAMVPWIPRGEVVGTDNYVSRDHGVWPGGYCWIYDGVKHYDAETLHGTDDWQKLPFFKRGLANVKTITWLSKDWMTRLTKPAVIISIGDVGEAQPDYGCDPIDVLRIEFDDIDQDLGPEYKMFDWTMARKILQYEYHYREHDIIVHCHAGISRSSAVALFLANKCNRALVIAKPCTGVLSRHNGWVHRQLTITRMDLIASGGNITK